MSLQDLAGFPTLIDRRYREIREQLYASIEDQVPLFFTEEGSDSFEERRGSIGELPAWDEFEGNLIYQRPYEQYNTVATHREFCQGLRWTRRMIDDDLTGIMRGDRYRKMVRAGIITKQLHAARLWNFAASNDMYFYSRSEGVPLASDSHTTRTPGVSTATGFDNLTTSELTPVSFRAARQQGRRFANDQGHIANIMMDTIVVPIELEQRAMEIRDSPGDADSARRSSNPEANTFKIVVPIYWTDVNDWALVNEQLMKENNTWFNRVPPDWKSIVDFETFQLKASGYMRYSWMSEDWRWLMFSRVS